MDTTTRRRFLATALPAACAVCAGAALLSATGCQEPAPKTPQAGDPVTLPLRELPSGAHRTVQFRGRPVHLRRTGGDVRALSLVCTHMGCIVRWSDEGQVYICPCHDGRFDADGRVVEGPPPRPLPTVPVRIDGDRIVVG